MRFRTEFVAERSALTLTPLRPALLLGSCFSDNIGARMRHCMWDARVNPAGVLYNPLSIASTIEMALDADSVEIPLVERDGMWLSWAFASQFHASGASQCEAMCREALRSLRSSLLEADALLVTFGTARVYSLGGADGRVVANCHKFPASRFTRSLVDADAIAALWQRLIARLRLLNPTLKIVLTVSPVRHLGDGFAGNALSKAVLLQAVHAIADATADCEYFPAFEILTDDLRDYRFYADDLLHPSQQAADYIFTRFCETFLTQSDRDIVDAATALRRALSHRPLLPGSQAAEAHKKAAAEKLEAFLQRYPGLRP